MSTVSAASVVRLFTFYAGEGELKLSFEKLWKPTWIINGGESVATPAGGRCGF